MINLAKICLVITVFGQIAYNSAIYYADVPHPSYPVWGILYLTVAILFARGAAPKEITRTDLLYVACSGWTVLSFATSGQSDAAAFIAMMAQFVVLPYIVGRFVGRYFTLADFRKVYMLAAIMLALVLVERARHPELFEGGDRLKVFTTDIHDPLQGGIAFFMASLFGSVVVIALSILTLPKKDMTIAGVRPLRWHQIAGGISLMVVFLWGSRGALVGLMATCLSIFAPRLRIAPGRVMMALCLVAIAFVGLYNVLPPERQAFIDEIPNGLASLGQSTICIQGETSVLAHLTYWRESAKLIGQYPLFGVGAGNFGHYWCGDNIDFMSPHSSILHALVDTGIAGAAVWMAMLWSVVQLYRYNAPLSGEAHILSRTLFLIWVFTFLVAQLNGNLYSDYQLYALTGVLVSYISHKRARAPARSRIVAAAGGETHSVASQPA